MSEISKISAAIMAIPIAHCFHGNSLITGTVQVRDLGNLTPPHVNKPTMTHDRAPTIPPRYCNTLVCRVTFRCRTRTFLKASYHHCCDNRVCHPAKVNMLLAVRKSGIRPMCVRERVNRMSCEKVDSG